MNNLYFVACFLNGYLKKSNNILVNFKITIDENYMTIITIIICLLCLPAYCLSEVGTKSQALVDEIRTIRNRIDSIDNVINIYTKEKMNYEYVYDFKIEKQLYQIAMDTLKLKKRNEIITSLTVSTIPFYSFRDPYLDSTYFEGYFNPDPAEIVENLRITSKNWCVSNMETNRYVYGFVNMHNRINEIEIDFENFDRIGIYSMFPEAYGSIEMIFSENKTLKKIQENLVNQAHRYNTKVDLVLSYHAWDTLNNLKPRIEQDVVILNMVDSISSIIKIYNFDGITVDFDISKMSLRDIIYYKKFIYMVHKEVESINKKVNINIVISSSDIMDTVKYCPEHIDRANLIDNQNSKSKKSQDTINCKKYNKLDLLLKPDLREHIDHFLINNDMDSVNFKSISSLLDSLYGISSSDHKKIIMIISLHSQLFKLNGDNNWNYVASILQRDYKKIQFKENSKVYVADLDTLYRVNDLSIKSLEDKMKNIWNSSMGIALWHIEYGDSSFYAMLHKNKYMFLTEFYTPRIFVIKHFRLFRAFIDKYRITIAIIVSFFVLAFVSCISFLKIAGREKYLKTYRNYLVVTGFLLTITSYVYLITIPFDVNGKVETLLFAILLIILLLIAGYHVYKIKRSVDLP